MKYEVKYKNKDGRTWVHELESSISNVEEASKQFRAECASMGFQFISCHKMDEKGTSNAFGEEAEAALREVHDFRRVPSMSSNQAQLHNSALLFNLKREQEQNDKLRAMLRALVDWFDSEEGESKLINEWVDAGSELFDSVREYTKGGGDLHSACFKQALSQLKLPVITVTENGEVLTSVSAVQSEIERITGLYGEVRYG